MPLPRKLTAAGVRHIRDCHRLRSETPSVSQLAELYGVDRKTIRKVQNGMTYKVASPMKQRNE